MNEIQKKLLHAAKMSHEKNVLSVLKDVDLIEVLDELERSYAEVRGLKEQVAFLESKEVCTQPHDDDVIEGCPYCKIEEFQKDVTKRMACKHLPSAWTKRWVCSHCCEIIDNCAANALHEDRGNDVRN